MTHIITTQHIQIALFGIKFDVVSEDGRRQPKHIGEETVLLYVYIYIYIYICIIKLLALQKEKYLHFRLLPRCSSELRSSGKFRGLNL